MSYHDAISFFIQYSNLHGTPEQCLKVEPTISQLRNAADYARRFSSASQQEINEAVLAVFWRTE